jgi:hypothetical protein
MNTITIESNLSAFKHGIGKEGVQTAIKQFVYNDNMIKWGGDPESMIDISLCYNELYNLKK